MEYKDRVKAARTHACLTQGQLAEALNMAQASLSDIERGRSQSSSYNARIAKICGVSAYWLETGEGEMLEAEFNSAPSLMQYVLIPTYSPDGSKESVSIKRSWIAGLNEKHLVAAPYDEAGMEPSILPGDHVLVDTSQCEPRDSYLFAIRRAGGSLSIRQLKQGITGNWMVMTASQTESLTSEQLSAIDILGRVVWRAGSL